MSANKVFWRIIRHAAKRSWKRFKSFGEIVTNIIYVVAAAVVLKFATKELGDVVIYWALAVPPLLWWVYFIWYGFKLFHRINPRPFPAIATTLLLLVFLCIIFLFIGQSKITQFGIETPAQKTSIPTNLYPAVASKPLPDKIIPAPEPPPVPVAAVKPSANTEPSLQFETNAADGVDAESEFAKSKAAQLAQKQVNLQTQQLKAQEAWTNCLPIYNDSLKALYDILTAEKIKRQDQLVITKGFLQCLPESINPAIGDMNVAEIKFQTETNLDFKVSVTKEFWIEDYFEQPRRLAIDCKVGRFQIHEDLPRQGFWVNVKTTDLNYATNVSKERSNQVVQHYLKILVGGQIAYLSNTNK